MAASREKMMERVLGQLSSAGMQGVEIEKLFHNFENVIKGDDDDDTAVWDSLLARADIIVVDEKGTRSKIHQSPVIKLSLQDISTFSLGKWTLYLEEPEPPAISTPTSQAETPSRAPTVERETEKTEQPIQRSHLLSLTEDGRIVIQAAEASAHVKKGVKRKAPEPPASPVGPPKKRGRPRIVRPEGWEPRPPPKFPGRKGRPPKGSSDPQAEDPQSLAGPENASQEESTHLYTPQASPQQPFSNRMPQQLGTGTLALATTRNSLGDERQTSGAILSSEIDIFEDKVASSGPSPNSRRNLRSRPRRIPVAQHEPAPSTTKPATVPEAANSGLVTSIEADIPASGENVPTANKEAEDKKALEPSDTIQKKSTPEITPAAASSTARVRKTPRTKGPRWSEVHNVAESPAKNEAPQNFPWKVVSATEFILDRQEDTPKVYINPHIPDRYWGSSDLMVVFRSSQLKDPERLIKMKNNWVDTLADRVTAGIIEAEEQTHAPDRAPKRLLRGHIPGSTKPSKKKRTIQEGVAVTIPSEIDFAGVVSEQTPSSQPEIQAEGGGALPNYMRNLSALGNAINPERVERIDDSMKITQSDPKSANQPLSSQVFAPQISLAQASEGISPISQKQTLSFTPERLRYNMYPQAQTPQRQSYTSPFTTSGTTGSLYPNQFRPDSQQTGFPSGNYPFGHISIGAQRLMQMTNPSVKSYSSPYTSPYGGPPSRGTQSVSQETQVVPATRLQAESSPFPSDPATKGPLTAPETPINALVKESKTNSQPSSVTTLLVDADGIRPSQSGLPAADAGGKHDGQNPALRQPGDSSSTPPATRRPLLITAPRFIQHNLADAEKVAFPAHAARLTCIFTGNMGNLVMLQDKTSLEFFAVPECPPHLPKLVVPISYITDSPKVSMKGSEPMEILISAKDADGRNITYRFQFALDANALTIAQNMRSKIMSARLAYQFRHAEAYERPTDVQAQIAKPFACEKCGNRFKNKGGLDYHVTKSNTSCNPDYDLSKAKPKKTRKVADPKEIVKEVLVVRESSAPRSSRAHSQTQPNDNQPDIGPVNVSEPEKEKPQDTKKAPEVKKASEIPDIGNDSDDSVIEFWQKTVGPSPKGRGKAKKVKIYKNLPNEAVVLQSLMKDLAASKDVVSTTEGQRIEIDVPTAPTASQQQGVSTGMEPLSGRSTLSGSGAPFVESSLPQTEESSQGNGSSAESSQARVVSSESVEKFLPEELTDEQREDIVMSLVQVNGGVFPGDHSIWIASVAICLQIHSGEWELLQSKFWHKSVDDMVMDKKLKRVEFTITDSRKREVVRSYLAIPDFNDRSQLKSLKEAIGTSYPAFYIPDKLAISENVLVKLQAIARRTVAKVLPDLLPQNTDFSPEPEKELSLESSPRFDSGSEEDDAFTPEAVNDFDMADEMLDEIYELEDSGTPASRYGKGSRGPRPPEFKAMASANMKQRWAEAKVAGLNNLSASGLQSQVQKSRETRVKVPLTQEEKNKRARQAAQRQRSWGMAPSFMQNPQTGAWDEHPVIAKPAKRPREFKPRLPEVVTYMQSESGAWNVRPKGHGVFPVHARPARRTDGNPQLPSYLARLENGHRPVVFPQKNRQFLPPLPSKVLIRSLSNPPISKITGLPKRNYARNLDASPAPRYGSKLGPPYKVIDGVKTRVSRLTGLPPRAYNWRNTRSITAREENGFTEAEIVLYYEAPKLQPDAPLNIGLETIPASFGLDSSLYSSSSDFNDGFPSIYSTIEFVEAKLIDHDMLEEEDDDEGMQFEDGSWTFSELEAAEQQYSTITWRDELEFDMRTLPYDHMDDGENSQPVNEEMDLDPPSPPKRRRTSKWLAIATSKPDKSERRTKHRTLTALAEDFKGVLKNPRDAVNLFNVELAPPNNNTRKRQRVMGNLMSPETEQQLLVTVVVIRTLTGGLDQLVDWVLVSQLFQDYSIHFLKKSWLTLSQRKKNVIEQLTTDFQELFPNAYRKGEVPPINYDNLVSYDWGKAIAWAFQHIAKEFENKPIEIPDNKKALAQMYKMNLVDRDENGWREPYFSLFTPVYKRVQAATAEPLTLPLIPSPKPSTDSDPLFVMKTWVRATALTPRQHWSIEGANERFKLVDPEPVKEALHSLLETKCLKKTGNKGQCPGRPYDVTDAFVSTWRRHIRMPQIIEAVEFKRWLDSQFRANGGAPVTIDYMSNEGAITAISSMVAHGRIDLRSINVPMNKFGLTDGGYETRTIPRERWQFDVQMLPTSTYIYDSDNSLVHNALKEPAPWGPDKPITEQEIPIWYGITGKLIDEVWGKTLVCVASTIALRTGITIKELERIFAPTLLRFDLEYLLQWGEKIGIFERLDEERVVEGWTVGEWWWSVVGGVCEEGVKRDEDWQREREELVRKMRGVGTGIDSGDRVFGTEEDVMMGGM